MARDIYGIFLQLKSKQKIAITKKVILISGFFVRGKEIDLDYHAHQLAKEFADSCGTSLRWYDLYGNQPHLKEQYPE